MKTISAKQQLKLRIANNKHKKVLAETLMENKPSEGSNGTYPVLLLLLLFSFLVLLLHFF